MGRSSRACTGRRPCHTGPSSQPVVPLAPLAPQCGVPATQMEVLFGGTGEWGLAIPGAQFPGARTATPSWEWHSPGVITVLGDHLQSLPWAQQTSLCFRATQEGGNDAASFQAGQRCSRKAVQGATQLLRVGVPSLANLRHTRPQPGFTGHLLPVPWSFHQPTLCGGGFACSGYFVYIICFDQGNVGENDMCLSSRGSSLFLFPLL